MCSHFPSCPSPQGIKYTYIAQALVNSLLLAEVEFLAPFRKFYLTKHTRNMGIKSLYLEEIEYNISTVNMLSVIFCVCIEFRNMYAKNVIRLIKSKI